MVSGAPGFDRGELHQLLRRILASPQFAHADCLQRILQLLFERTSDPAAPPLKEFEIAVDAIRRPASFDPKTDAIVRVSIANIRERLSAYFETQGRQEGLRVSVPKGRYRVEFSPGSVAEPERDQIPVPVALRRLWKPYVSSGNANLLLYNELLCFRDARGNYYRNIYINDPSVAAEDVLRNFANAGAAEIRPSYHFVSGGEMHGVVSMVQAFHEMNALLTVRNSRFVSWADIQSANLIILGSARTSSFVDRLQSDEHFVVNPDSIEDRDTVGRGPKVYRGARFTAGSLERTTEHALVTRKPGPVSGSSFTLICANHGRAMEGAVHFLTREDKVAELLTILAPDEQGSAPAHFQVLLRVEMVDFDEEVMDVQYVTHKLYP